MRIRLRRWVVLVLCVSASAFGLASFGSAASAAAPNEVEPIRIDYQAPAECPSGSEFERRVFARTQSARLAASGEAARIFQVRVRRTASGITGTLMIREPNGSSMERTVTGDQCSELATVLALASALAIDPRAELAPDQQLEDDQDHPAFRPTPPGTSPTPPGTSPTPPGTSPTPPGTSPTQDVTAPPRPAAVVGPKTPWQWRLALGTRASWGLSSSVAPGATAMVTAAGGLSAWGLEAAAAFGSPERVRGGRAKLRYWVLRPQFCPWSANFSSGIALGPCLVAEAGGVEGQGGEVADPKRQWRFWMNLELAVRLRWQFTTHWFGELDAGVGSPITRYRFIFTDPQTTVHDVPVVNTTLAARLGYRF